MSSPETPQRSIQAGSGRRRGRNFPRGRQVEPAALAEVQALLGETPRQRDLLIEFLHRLQDKFGCLHARHLTALADEMRLALVEVYEVASFYAHFDIVLDGEPAPPPLTVRVCDSLTCELMGAERILAELPREARGRGAGGARALHGRLPQRAGGGAWATRCTSTRASRASPPP